MFVALDQSVWQMLMKFLGQFGGGNAKMVREETSPYLIKLKATRILSY